MAGINAVDIQVGLSVTPANNFVLDASADDGTLILRDGAGVALMTMVAGGEAESYARDNILGVVSESSGVPTGAIIESGSNANGEYVKYADGTLICTFMGTDNLEHIFAVGTLFQSSGVTMTFPSVFTVAPKVAVSVDLVTTGAWGYNTSPTASQVLAYIVATENTGTAKLGYIAIGRWF
jgi:hypothetical protein